MAHDEDARARARRKRFREDRDVFMALRPGDPVCVLWVSSGWEPYGGKPDAPPVRELLYEVVSGPSRRVGYWGVSYGFELKPAPGIPKRYAKKWAQLLLRAEEDAPRHADGSIDYSSTGAVNTVALIFREAGAGSALTSGGWVHLKRAERLSQMELGLR